MHAVAPCYFHPAEHPEGWEWLRHSSLAWAVVNVHDGPGADGDPYYTPLLGGWDGPPLCGYVNVDYGRRHHGDVLADAAAWRERHGVSALMLDCFPVEAGLSSGVELVRELHARGHDFIVANAGRSSPEPLLAMADVTCVAELAWDDYKKQHFTPSAHSTWHLVHSVPPSQLSTARQLMARNGASYGWATPGTLPHPWGWHEEFRTDRTEG